jgi:hydroxyacylglutathione hydrolase
MFMNSFDINKYQRIDSPNSKGHPVPIIESIITEYMPNISSRLQLIVGHSHSHKDHIAGDDEMRNFSMPMVTTHVIPPCLDSVKSYYKIQSWPNTPAVLDLGGSRVLDIIPLPGHKDDSIAIYDRQTGLLLTGDSVYPGRIYIPRSLFRTFKKSHSRLRRLIKKNHWEVSWVLGGHIEQKQTARQEYPMRTKYQPEEHVLQLDVSILEKVAHGLKKIDDEEIDDEEESVQHMFDEFSLVIE